MIDLTKPLVVVCEDGSVEHICLADRGNGKVWPDDAGDAQVCTKKGVWYFKVATGQRLARLCQQVRNATPDEIRAHVAAERERLDAMEAEANKPVVDAVTLWWRECKARSLDLNDHMIAAGYCRAGMDDRPNEIEALRTLPGFVEYAEKCVKELGL